MYEESVKDPEKFWNREARKLEWFRTWDKVLEWDPPFARWFVGGLPNTSYLCLRASRFQVDQLRVNES
ncbi:MAG: hypothetical protein OEZ35_07425 [Candidatus Bathyarchaeota archaeon]|nr:hypothetical protein [Candidatus Bathyarchaeota archaeon]